MYGQYLVALAAIILGCTIVIIPVAGLTARFAIKPLIESWMKMREAPASDEHVRILERRIAMLEKQVEVLERDSSRLLEDADFRQQLRG